MSAPLDTLISGGTLIDPIAGRNGLFDIGITDGKVSAIESSLASATAKRRIDATGKLVLPGLIDTHAHVYEHVTGKFGLHADSVGVHSGATVLVDQGGPSCMTIGGFRHFVAAPAASRVLCFISGYLVGGLEGHRYPDLYSPKGVNVDHTVRAIEENRDLVKGVKAHAEIGGASRWGLEVIKLTKEIARQTELPLYIHLGQLWPHKENTVPDPDALVRELVPILDEGDILAHPFTRHPGGFVSDETGDVHPIIWEAIDRGVTVDVGHGSHFSFEMARRALEAGIIPHTLGADMHGYNVQLADDDADGERAKNPFFGVAPFNLTIAMTELL
ncbi:MAG: amidohydrolase/deacetylase family metallohydrolase, partial [Gammaproteobacteria bacterium]|nr:amidohydrolase/deacetylase family metallohydrolase [Gammaproteobacteria bacterium]